MTLLRGLVFDLDGTLVDTSYLHTVSWWEALRQHGHHVSMAAIHGSIGMPGGGLLDSVLGTDRDHAADARIMDAHSVAFRSWEGRIPPTPGAGLLVRWCKDMGLRIAVASSAHRSDLDLLLGALGRPEFDVVVTGDDVEEGKPHPDSVATALSRAALGVEEALLVGDAVWDIAAARRIGLPSAGLECGGTSAQELTAAGATVTFRDPHALVCALHSVMSHDATRADWVASLAAAAAADGRPVGQEAR